MEKTYKQLSQLDNAVAEMIVKNPDLKSAKFGYHYRIFHEKNLKPIFDDYNKALAHIRIDCALTNPTTKALMTTESGRGFEFSKEGRKMVIQAEMDLEKEWDNKNFEIEPYKIDILDIPNPTYEFIELAKEILI